MSNPLCKCYSKIAYRVTAEDIPEADAETFQEYDVHESCGLQVSNPKREFRPGHDAKFKSVLIKAHRNGGDFAFTDGGVLIHSSAMNEASKRGWGKFMTAAPAKKAEKAKAAKVAGVSVEVQIAEAFAATAPAEEAPAGFYPVQVRVRGTWYDGIVVNRADGKVHVAYEDRKGNPREVTVEDGGDRIRSA